MCLAYDGTGYAGWQVQTKQPWVKTVQGTVEEALRRITKEPDLMVTGAGRTDAGVHARGQVIHFDTASRIPIDRFPLALNSVLPADIRCWQAEEVPGDFHAQYSAKAKYYSYTIDQGPVPDVFWRHYAYHFTHPLDLEAMAEAGARLLGTHDFRSFCASGSAAKNFVRTILEFNIRKSGSLLHITLAGDGFLYNMVRIIVGTLLEIGQGKRPPAAMEQIILARDRNAAGPTVPAKGLCLEKVIY